MSPADLPLPNGAAAAADSVVRRAVVLNNPSGLHMRPATRVSEIAKQFASQLVICHGERRGNARSLMEMLLLGIEPGSELIVVAEGPDSEAAAEAVAVYIGADDWDS